MTLDLADRRRITDLVAMLRSGAAGAELGSEVLPALSQAIHADRVGCHAIRPAGSGLALEFALGLTPSIWGDFEKVLTESRTWTFDPIRVARPDRNRARVVDGVVASHLLRFPSLGWLIHRQPWFVEDHQLRLLVCDGPALMAWIGGFRTARRFTHRDQKLLQALAPPLVERFRFERDLGRARIAVAALPAALEELPSAAFVVSGSGAVLHANTAGRALVDAGRSESAAVRRALACVGEPSFRWVPLGGPGEPASYLAIAQRSRPGHADRAALLARRWGLTPRQVDVLGHVALGRANKVVAAELGCAEVTVEFHVTALLHKVGCESRAELVARFWNDG